MNCYAALTSRERSNVLSLADRGFLFWRKRKRNISKSFSTSQHRNLPKAASCAPRKRGPSFKVPSIPKEYLRRIFGKSPPLQSSCSFCFAYFILFHRFRTSEALVRARLPRDIQKGLRMTWFAAANDQNCCQDRFPAPLTRGTKEAKSPPMAFS